jgi:anthranilate synthase/aminodeoxychorismate synthase-like glutamine amidotransferase
MQISLIDHYDSFSFNLLEWLRDAGKGLVTLNRICYDDDASIRKLSENLTPIVISPGPGKPSDYSGTKQLLKKAIGNVPVLGVCLGHQMLGEAAGGIVQKAKDPWHGTTFKVTVKETNWMTKELPKIFTTVAYNSLIVDLKHTNKSEWCILAEDEYGQTMMLSHTKLPIGSVQFHPESFASDDLSIIARNFFSICR